MNKKYLNNTSDEITPADIAASAASTLAAATTGGASAIDSAANSAAAEGATDSGEKSSLHQPTYRVVRVLRELRKFSEGLSNAELARQCDIQAGTLHPILKTLCELHVCKCEGYRYQLIDESSLQSYRMEKINTYASELASELALSVQVGVLRATRVLYVLKLDGGSKVILRTSVGDLIPAHSTSIGKTLLSQYSDNFEDLKRYLAIKNGRLEALSKNTITDPRALQENINMYKSLGYFSEQGEFDEDFICFSVPLKCDGRIFAGLGVTVLRFFLSEELRARIIDRLRHYGNLINKTLEH